MTSYYTIESANERLAELRPLLELLRQQREDLIALRDLTIERMAAVEAGREASGAAGGQPAAIEDDAQLRRIRLRMQGIVDQMQAAVAQIDEWDVTLRDIETGLIDFPALVSGRPIWLCWRLGEDGVEWWHDVRTGFEGRRPLEEIE